MNDAVIQWNKQLLALLKDRLDYLEHIDATGDDTFLFEGHMLRYDYAKYLYEYVNGKLNDGS